MRLLTFFFTSFLIGASVPANADLEVDPVAAPEILTAIQFTVRAEIAEKRCHDLLADRSAIGLLWRQPRLRAFKHGAPEHYKSARSTVKQLLLPLYKPEKADLYCDLEFLALGGRTPGRPILLVKR